MCGPYPPHELSLPPSLSLHPLRVGCSVETIALSLWHQTSPTAATLPIDRILI
uniref:Uncharacterized protein n=1 Tax=Fagus sylvatica TaxID=28930 RepID=A0A2N9GD87_FAGSY